MLLQYTSEYQQPCERMCPKVTGSNVSVLRGPTAQATGNSALNSEAIALKRRGHPINGILKYAKRFILKRIIAHRIELFCSSRPAFGQQSAVFLLGHDIRKLLNCGSVRGLDTVKNISYPS